MTISDIIYSELTSTRKLTSAATARHFRRWKEMIEFVLVDAHLNYVLSDPSPDSSSSEPSSENWLSDDKRCRRIILFAMDDLLFDVYSLHKTSKEIMDSLSKIYNDTDPIGIHQRYRTHKMAEDTPIIHHLNEMCALAVDLEHAGMPMPEDCQIRTIRKSLPDSWVDASLTIKFLAKDLEDFMLRLRDWGARKKEMEEEEELEWKVRKRGNKGFRGNCYGCGQPGHCQAYCPNKVMPLS